jgi:hypothetical protein
MKLTHIRVENTLGMRRADIQIRTAILMLCGQNFAGKSSLQESVRMALCGETVRVSLKKDFSEMVSDGAKNGYVEVSTDTGYGKMALPKGTHTLEDPAVTPVLPYVLNAQKFAKLSDDDRREFLFKLTGLGVEPNDIRRRLNDKKVDMERAEQVIPMLLSAKTASGKRAGFPEACAAAASYATESKGAWRATTGEVWGSLKGASWKAEAPEVDPAEIGRLHDSVQTLDNQIADVNASLAAIDRRIVLQGQQEQEQAQRQALIAKLPNLQAKLAKDQAELAEWEAKLKQAQEAAGQVQRAGLVHQMARFIKVAGLDNDADVETANKLWEAYVREHGEPGKAGDPEAAQLVPMYLSSKNLMASSVANDQRDIATAETAKAQHAIVAEFERVDQTERDRLADERTALRAQADEAKKALDKLLQAQGAAENAANKTEKAAMHHKEVLAWLKIAEALDADGIPSEMLAQALKPMNNALRDYASVTQWAQVAISPDMTIKSNGRRYSLLSESEQWRADAMIAAAIAELSGTRILMLDRFDVLDLPGREDLVIWLDQMAQDSRLDTALIFGTMKAKPNGLPPTIEALWVENGEVTNVEYAAA